MRGGNCTRSTGVAGHAALPGYADCVSVVTVGLRCRDFIQPFFFGFIFSTPCAMRPESQGVKNFGQGDR